MIFETTKNGSVFLDLATVAHASAQKAERTLPDGTTEERWHITLVMEKPNGEVYSERYPMKNRADAEAVLAAVEAAP